MLKIGNIGGNEESGDKFPSDNVAHFSTCRSIFHSPDLASQRALDTDTSLKVSTWISPSADSYLMEPEVKTEATELGPDLAFSSDGPLRDAAEKAEKALLSFDQTEPPFTSVPSQGMSYLFAFNRVSTLYPHDLES